MKSTLAFLARHLNRGWKKVVAAVVVLILLGIAWDWLYDKVINVAPYEQKVVLITGTASGIGKATAERLIALGHIVYGGDIQFEKNRYLDEIGGHSLDMDVTDAAMVQAGVNRIIEEQGRIDVLFNNAGFGLVGAVEEVTMEDVRHQFEVNVFGYGQLIKAVAPHMRAQGEGLIINNSSMAGRVYSPLASWYHASKYAVEGLSDGLRFELAPFGIAVVVLEPGLLDTNFDNVASEYAAKYAEGTAYGDLYESVVLTSANVDPDLLGSPDIVAEVVEQVIRSKTPDTRYLFGPTAKHLVYTKELFGDRVYDWLMREWYRQAGNMPNWQEYIPTN